VSPVGGVEYKLDELPLNLNPAGGGPILPVLRGPVPLEPSPFNPKLNLGGIGIGSWVRALGLPEGLIVVDGSLISKEAMF